MIRPRRPRASEQDPGEARRFLEKARRTKARRTKAPAVSGRTLEAVPMLVLVFLVPLVSACSDCDGRKPDELQLPTVADYVPRRPGARFTVAGRTQWNDGEVEPSEMSVRVVGPAVVDGRAVIEYETVMRQQGPGGKELRSTIQHWAVASAEQTYTYALRFAGGEREVDSPPWIDLQGPIREGTRWEFDTASQTDPNAILRVRSEIAKTGVELEDWRDCIKVRVQVESRGPGVSFCEADPIGVLRQTRNGEQWFCPGVGSVREHFSTRLEAVDGSICRREASHELKEWRDPE